MNSIGLAQQGTDPEQQGVEKNWNRLEVTRNGTDLMRPETEGIGCPPHRNELEKRSTEGSCKRRAARGPGDEQQCYGYAEQRSDKKRSGTDPLRDEPAENSSAQE